MRRAAATLQVLITIGYSFWRQIQATCGYARRSSAVAVPGPDARRLNRLFATVRHNSAKAIPRPLGRVRISPSAPSPPVTLHELPRNLLSLLPALLTAPCRRAS